MMSLVATLAAATLFVEPAVTAWHVPADIEDVTSAMVPANTTCGILAGLFTAAGRTSIPLPVAAVSIVVLPLDEPASLRSPLLKVCAAFQVFALDDKPDAAPAASAPTVL
jgi:hypothetical protein